MEFPDIIADIIHNDKKNKNDNAVVKKNLLMASIEFGNTPSCGYTGMIGTNVELWRKKS